MTDHRICQAAAEHVHIELLEAQDRIAELTAERDTYQELATEALGRLASLTEASARQRHIIADLRATVTGELPRRVAA